VSTTTTPSHCRPSKSPPRSKHPAPLIDALRQLTTNPATPNELLITMADRLPLASHNLAEWATELTG